MLVGNFIKKDGKMIFERTPPSLRAHSIAYYNILSAKTNSERIDAFAIAALHFLHIFHLFDHCIEKNSFFISKDIDKFLNIDEINNIIHEEEPIVFKLVMNEIYKKPIDIFIINQEAFFLFIEFCVAIYAHNITYIKFNQSSHPKINEIIKKFYFHTMQVVKPELLFTKISHNVLDWNFQENYKDFYYQICRSLIRHCYLKNQIFNLFSFINPSIMTPELYETLCVYGLSYGFSIEKNFQKTKFLEMEIAKKNNLPFEHADPINCTQHDLSSIFHQTEHNLKFGKFTNTTKCAPCDNALNEMFWRKMASRYPEQFFPYPENVNLNIIAPIAVSFNPWFYISIFGYKPISHVREKKLDEIVIEKQPFAILSLNCSRITPQLWISAIRKKSLLQLFL